MSQTIMVEVRAGEGGEDARLLVDEQVTIYAKYALRKGLSMEIVDQRPGMTVLQVCGEGARQAFQHESGGFKFQRVPPTEKRGRVHSSTITVALLDVQQGQQIQVSERDLLWETMRSQGAGGQNVNKVESAVRLTHKPSGMSIKVQSERSQHQNRRIALDMLKARLASAASAADADARANLRRSQIGTQERSDKRRTIALQRDEVVDHRLNRRIRASDYLAGKLDGLIGV